MLTNWYSGTPSEGWLAAKYPNTTVQQSYTLPCSTPPVAVSIQVAPAGEMTVLIPDVSGDIVTFVEDGGVPGRVYTILFTATQDSGLTEQWSVCQSVYTFAPFYPNPPAPPLVPSFSPPVTWTSGAPMPMLMTNLLPTTYVATGTTQLTAAPMTLSMALVNAGTGGVLLPKAATFCGQTMPVYNRSGATINVYPFSGDGIENVGVNMPIALENDQTGRFSVSQSGLLILS
jgi:hypothetical protein